MKNFVFTVALIALANVASAQMAQVDEDIAANLQMAITLSGFDCAQVINVEPVGSEGAKITCVLVDGSDLTGNYLFSVTADGLSITEE